LRETLNVSLLLVKNNI